MVGMMAGSWLERWLRGLAYLFFPRRCVVCGRCLEEGEEVLCLRCNMDMPRTNWHLEKDNPVEQQFWGKIPLERATSYFLYHKGSDFRRMLHLLKYEGREDIGRTMGRFMAEEMVASGFFNGVDFIVPVPLHPRKQRARGYNQSERLAEGIAEVTGIVMDVRAVSRRVYSQTQTRKSAYERWENVAGIFQVEHPERYVGKHILLVDDVLTTGSTITACADAFAGIEGLRISVLTLAKAGV